ncbi:MAG TPA: hypothetical protein VET27_07985 [Mycobacterium sp.]|nr:hypothetical protein [Mycobacterium sp.]
MNAAADHATSRKSLSRAVVLGALAAGCAGVVAAVTISPSAEADTNDPTTQAMAEYIVEYGPKFVCSAIDGVPTLDGVSTVVTAVAGDGWTSSQAVRIVQVSVDFYCAGHDQLLLSYLSASTPPPLPEILTAT